MVAAVVYCLWRRYCYVRDSSYRTVYAVREYEDMEQFEKGLNSMAEEGWELEEWNTEPLYDEETSFERMGMQRPTGHSSFQIYRVVFTK